MFSSDCFRNTDINPHRYKIDILDKIYVIAEETLYYKAKEIEEELVFIRKIILKFLKAQKGFVAQSLEQN
jgi:hypothetical protein